MFKLQTVPKDGGDWASEAINASDGQGTRSHLVGVSRLCSSISMKVTI